MKIGDAIMLSFEGRRSFPDLHRALARGKAIYLGESRKSSDDHRLIRVRRPGNKEPQIYWAGYWNV